LIRDPMNDPNESLENELRALRPAAPPARLARAIARTLDPDADRAAARVPLAAGVPRPARLSLVISWGITAAAACVALAFAFRGKPAPNVDPAPNPSAQVDRTDAGLPAGLRMLPVSTTGYLFATRDEGIVMLQDGRPARKMRYEFVDTVQMRALGESAAVSVSYPREEVRLIPVAFQ
jgi:hypothetical protein